jgi:hypothetical protein
MTGRGTSKKKDCATGHSSERVVKKREKYRGYVMSWQEPPMTSHARAVNLASDSPDLQIKLSNSGKIITGQSPSEAIANAKRFIDGLLALSVRLACAQFIPPCDVWRLPRTCSLLVVSLPWREFAVGKFGQG